MNENREQPVLMIVSAASGTGKSSLTRALVAADPRTVLSISHTTREIRGKEKNGIDYFFVSETEFEDMIARGEFVEHAKLYGSYYGTSRSMIENLLNSGNNVVLEIDWQGADQVVMHYPSAIRVFLLPPSIEELKSRLMLRGRDSESSINQRLSSAIEDMKNCLSYDYLILNDDFDAALSDLKSLLPGNIARARTIGDKLLQRLGVVGE